MTGRLWRGVLHALLLEVVAGLLLFGVVRRAHAQEAVTYNAADARVAIADAAVLYGVSEAWMASVTRCEAPGLDPYAVGDGGHSFGIAQLNDRRTGLLGHFHSLGYVSAFNPYEAADYLGRVFSGEFAGQGITWRRWSCR